MVLGIRVDRNLQAMLVASDPRFTIAKYVGKYGGVDIAFALPSQPRRALRLAKVSYHSLWGYLVLNKLKALNSFSETGVSVRLASR